MYKIEKTEFGIKLIFSGYIQSTEMLEWLEESKKILRTIAKQFYVFVDMRELKPLTPDVASIIQEGQALYKEFGMERSVVILNNAITTLQFKRIAKESGIYQWERYIDASMDKDWYSTGLLWLKQGLDPDKK